ncbi:putative membrane protein [Paraburkholderia sp. BL6665CI2N2]|uniref:CopD family protein n=1 Tax=Paraburkholderia sp. BL6665CI2N2 TaxID=1938806 RepID=UPI001064EE44|nr:CopD family protein [Paraburkholderia sp. BL6665CI2N2]TDY16959.1 putative membrane protein [Paraburkholderia sp. BL6665CI2N2]
MNVATYYPWLKALHVTSALIFFGGVVSVGVFLHMVTTDSPEIRTLAAAIRRLDHLITTPAMLLVWALGIGIGGAGHWFNAPWLTVKLIFVVALSAVHGMQSGKLRRICHGASISPLHASLPILVTCAVVIATLAVAKPF